MIGYSLGQLIAARKPYRKSLREVDPDDFEQEIVPQRPSRAREPWPEGLKEFGVFDNVGDAIALLPRCAGQVGIRLGLWNSGEIQRFAHTYAKRQGRAIISRQRDGIVWITERAEGVGK